MTLKFAIADANGMTYTYDTIDMHSALNIHRELYGTEPVEVKLLRCCTHHPHQGVCGRPITEDVMASADPWGYGPPVEHIRTIVVARCQCEGVA